MPIHTEQENFGERLRKAMTALGYSTRSPQTLVREFNVRFTGPSITLHGARKWLLGESIPTQEKLIVLSRWLNVTPEWLRYDGGEQQSGRPLGVDPYAQLRPDEIRLLMDYSSIDEVYREIVREITGIFARAAARKRDGGNLAQTGDP